MARRSTRLAFALGAVSLSACTAILGATAVPPLEDAMTVSPGDARSDAPTVTDAPVADGGRDATTSHDAPAEHDATADHDATTRVDGAVDAAADRGPDTKSPVVDACVVDACSYVSTVIADHPIAYWRLGESHGPVAANEVGDAFVGTYIGDVAFDAAGAIVGDDNGAVYLSGVRDGGHVTVPSPAGSPLAFQGKQAFSLEVWMKPTGPAGVKYRALVSNVVGDASRRGYNLDFGEDDAGGGLDISRFTDAGESYARWLGDANPGSAASPWHHVVATYGGTNNTETLYYDGSSVAVNSADDHAIQPFVCSLNIGASHCGTNSFFEGFVDEVAVYDYALMPHQVMVHYAVGTGTH